MSLQPDGFWQLAGTIGNLGGALATLVAAAWLAGRRERLGPAGTAIVMALFVTGLWSVAAGASFGSRVAPGLSESLRNLAWLLVTWRLFAGDGRHTELGPIRPVVLVLAIAEFCHLGIAVMTPVPGRAEIAAAIVFNMTVLLRLLFIVGGLVLVHNLYLGASTTARRALRWPAGALAVLWGFDLNLYTIAYLAQGWPAELAAARGLSVIGLAVLLALGGAGRAEALRLRPSRAMAFQTAALIVIGGYFLAMFAVAQWLAHFGGDFALLVEFGFLVGASVLALIVLPSRRLRAWLRVMIAKHLFQHRYDYRAEWLRFTRTIGNAASAQPLEERVVQAVADIAESPAGLLLAPDESGDLTLAARWQWPAAEVPALALGAAATDFFEQHSFVVDLDDWRAGKDVRGEGSVVPEWLRTEPRAWALVPLIHYERLTGVIVLARPLQPRKFDWEDFDLLRVVGQQLASYLAEHAGQQALGEAARFDDFHRRIAFVMHDIKNLASQLSLLARNAERHADKPAFRDDMLLTLRNSTDKLNALLARLSRYGSGSVDKLIELDAAEAVRSVVERFRLQHPVLAAQVDTCVVNANRESLEQVLIHLVQNAVDASAPGSAVMIGLTGEGGHVRLEIVDSGCGMSPEFIRTKLFKPFVSTKQGGFGIGAFEARELVRAMNGRLEVESREGLGSRFIVRLPLAAADRLFGAMADGKLKVA